MAKTSLYVKNFFVNGVGRLGAARRSWRRASTPRTSDRSADDLQTGSPMWTVRPSYGRGRPPPAPHPAGGTVRPAQAGTPQNGFPSTSCTHGSRVSDLHHHYEF